MDLAVPTVYIRWISHAPMDLVQVVLEVVNENSTYVGSGSTLAEAFENVARSLRHRAEMKQERELRSRLKGE